MRALFVTHAFPRNADDIAGGFILRLAAALRGVGVDVSVLAPSGPGLAARDEFDGVPVERFRYAPASWETLAYEGTMAEQVSRSWRGKMALAGMLSAGSRAVSRAVAGFRPDVVHAHWWFPSGVECMLAASARPLVLTFHGSDVRLAASTPMAPTALRAVMQQ